MLHGYRQLCLRDRDGRFLQGYCKRRGEKVDKSGYLKDDNRSLPIGKNKKMIGLMKDKLGGKIMVEFVSLRAKMYDYRKIDHLAAQHEHFVACDKKRCKGTKKCMVSEGFTFDDYKACLFDGETIYREQMLFENKKHELCTVNKYRIALNRDDDKRLVQADGIATLARGYVALLA